jgi:tetrahydromethanopterin S-methyltransferase subunit F
MNSVQEEEIRYRKELQERCRRQAFYNGLQIGMSFGVIITCVLVVIVLKYVI